MLPGLEFSGIWPGNFYSILFWLLVCFCLFCIFLRNIDHLGVGSLSSRHYHVVSGLLSFLWPSFLHLRKASQTCFLHHRFAFYHDWFLQCYCKYHLKFCCDIFPFLSWTFPAPFFIVISKHFNVFFMKIMFIFISLGTKQIPSNF